MTWENLYNNSSTYEIEKRFYQQLRDYISGDLKYKIDICMALNAYKEIIVLGIGTNKEEAFFDTYGPRVVSLLQEHDLKDFVECYGTMKKPLHAINLPCFLIERQVDLRKKLVIAIDSCVTNNPDGLGCLRISNTGLKPGAGVGKKIDEVGDLSIVGFTIKNNLNFFGMKKEGKNQISISVDKMIELSTITAEVLSMALSKVEKPPLEKEVIKKINGYY